MRVFAGIVVYDKSGLTICQCVVTNVVTRTICEDEEDGRCRGGAVCRSAIDGGHGLLHGDGPADVAE